MKEYENPCAAALKVGPRSLRVPILVTLVFLSLCGFLIAFYLIITHYRNTIPPCYITSGCDSVLTSRFSTILGLPLSLIGSVFFVVMFYLGIALLTSFQTIIVRSYQLLASAGFLAAVILFLLQAFVLKAYCVYCIGTEIIACSMWGGSLTLTSSRKGGRDPASVEQ